MKSSLRALGFCRSDLGFLPTGLTKGFRASTTRWRCQPCIQHNLQRRASVLEPVKPLASVDQRDDFKFMTTMEKNASHFNYQAPCFAAGFFDALQFRCFEQRFHQRGTGTNELVAKTLVPPSQWHHKFPQLLEKIITGDDKA